MITVQLMTPWNVRSFGKERVEAGSRWQPQTGHRSYREPAGALGGLFCLGPPPSSVCSALLVPATSP